ncbi:MAG: protein kinase [Microcystis sp. LE19-114.1B]|nr:protein kinase [Microcystis sp. LE19-114.1B]
MLELNQLLAGHYKVLRALGEGGLAKTYIVEDLHRPGHPQCAVKYLKPASNDPDFLPTARRLFKEEAENLEVLGEHDQIPRLLAYFEENQEFYLVQEFIEGHTLDKELPPGVRWTESKIIAFLQDVLPILEFVHSYKVIHRDIKPNNLIRRDRDDRLVLIDFGAVKKIRNPGTSLQTSHSPLTISIGTEGYMPTEQVRGKPRFNSDIYALGIIAIQAATGMDPLKLQVLDDDKTGELLWRDYANVSDGLAAILNKMVSYHFKDRYQSATEIIQALAALTSPSQAPISEETNPSTVSTPIIRETRVSSEQSGLRETRVSSEQSGLRETKVNLEVQASIPLIHRSYRRITTLKESPFRQTYIAENIERPEGGRYLIKRLIKPTDSAIDGPTAQRLFAQEADALKKIGEHDQIPRLIDYFEEDGAFYLIREYVTGHPLTEELPPHHFWTETEVIALLREVLTILQFIHGQEVIHLDIKPDNLIRRQQDNHLVLVDFGAVKKFPGVAEDNVESFNSNGSPGTSGYMSTEQARGKPRPSSDIYALGAIAIQALTGIDPKNLPDDPETGEISWQQRVRIGAGLEAILTKMVRYHFKDRYKTATEAMQALDELVPTAPATTTERATNKVARPPVPIPRPPRRFLTIGVGALLTLGAIAMAGSWFLYAKSPEFYYQQLEKSLEQKDWKKADELTYKLMLRIAGPESERQGRFNLEEWQEFDCDDFKKIDALWHRASDGNLGFRVQYNIFFARVKKDVNLFYKTIRWRNPQGEVTVEWKYDPQTKRVAYLRGKEPLFTDPPRGHLPAILEWNDGKDHRFDVRARCQL